jgi:hypothetical protein
MGSARAPERPRVVEMRVAEEVWVDGIVEAQKVGGGVYRLLWYKVRRPPGSEGPSEHAIQLEMLVLANRLGPIITLLRSLVDGDIDPSGLSVH